MKSLLGIIVAALTFNAIPAFAGGARLVQPTYPGTSEPDYRKPGFVIQDDGSAYQTYPGTSEPDYRKPGFIVK